MRAQALQPNWMHMIYQAHQDIQGKLSGESLILCVFLRECHRNNKEQPWFANFGGYILLPLGVVMVMPVECNTVRG
jgi:hypothetical protein